MAITLSLAEKTETIAALKAAQGYVAQFMVERAKEWRAEHGESRPESPTWQRAYGVHVQVAKAWKELEK